MWAQTPPPSQHCGGIWEGGTNLAWSCFQRPLSLPAAAPPLPLLSSAGDACRSRSRPRAPVRWCWPLTPVFTFSTSRVPPAASWASGAVGSGSGPSTPCRASVSSSVKRGVCTTSLEVWGRDYRRPSHTCHCETHRAAESCVNPRLPHRGPVPLPWATVSLLIACP